LCQWVGKIDPRCNFSKVLLADPKCAKNAVKSSVFFALSGSASVKAARRTLVKLTFGVHGVRLCDPLAVALAARRG